MKEEQLQFIWLNRLFDAILLDGRYVEVLDVGQQNSYAGADFQMARLCIDGLEWVGAVEIHEYSSMWRQHGHDRDGNYNSVILHVVLENDEVVYRADGRVVPTAVMQVDDEVVRRINKLGVISKSLRCMPELSEVARERVRDILSQLFAERLSSKLSELNRRSSEGHVNAIFYQTLMRYMGAHQNNEAMEMVASSLPYIYLKKHSSDLVALEAMLLGQAGLIQEVSRDDYEEKLLSEYEFYKRKFDLHAPAGVGFSYLRLRPSSYPSRMLAIIAQIIHHEEELLAAISALEKREIERILTLPPSTYWQKHIAFAHQQSRTMGGVGKQTLKSLIINVVIPTACYYAERVGDDGLRERAIEWLRELSPEKNQYVKIFEQYDMPPSNALESQAFLELYHSYCRPYRCLVCPMASEIFRQLKSK